MTRQRATLVYMPGRGIADSIRLLLEVGGWEWDEYHPESREDFLVVKAETVHGTIPYLRIHDGAHLRILEQCPAIIKYLARRAGLYPEQIDEQYRADMLCSLLCDYTVSIGFAPFADDPVEAVAKLRTDVSPRYLPSLERALCDNDKGDGFCGGDLSFVDLQAFATLSFCCDFHEDALTAHPRLEAFVDRIVALPGVVTFLARRYGLPDEDYVARAKSIVLGA